MAKVDIIVPVYNAEETIVECVASVIQQSYDEWELIIIDDGCTDKTIDVIKMFNDDRITILKNKYEKSVCGALNTGFEYSKNTDSDFVARFDADDIMLSHRLEYQMKFFDKHPEVDIAGSYIVRCKVGDNPRETGKVFSALPRHEDIKTALLFFNPISHPTVMMRKHVIGDVQYNPDMVACEDFDLWTRLIDKYTFSNMPFPTIIYRTSENSQQSRLIGGKEYRDSIVKIFTHLFHDVFMIDANVQAWSHRFVTKKANQHSDITYQAILDKYTTLGLNPIMMHKVYNKDNEDNTTASEE